MLVEALRGRAVVAEVGTAAAWTAGALLLAEPGRRVLELGRRGAPAARHHPCAPAPGGPRAPRALRSPGRRSGRPTRRPVDAVFIDSSHEKEETLATFRTWEPALAPGGVVAFHDWDDPAYPGVTEAIRELGLTGHASGHLFVWRKPA